MNFEKISKRLNFSLFLMIVCGGINKFLIIFLFISEITVWGRSSKNFVPLEEVCQNTSFSVYTEVLGSEGWETLIKINLVLIALIGFGIVFFFREKFKKNLNKINLQRERYFSSQALNLTNNMVIRINDAGIIEEINKAAEHKIGVSSVEIVGQLYDKIFRRFVNAEEKSLLREISNNNKNEDKNPVLMELLLPNNKKMHLSEKLEIIKNEKQQIIGVFQILSEDDGRIYPNAIMEKNQIWDIIFDVFKCESFKLHTKTLQIYGNLQHLEHFWSFDKEDRISFEHSIMAEDLVLFKKNYKDLVSGEKKYLDVVCRAERKGNIHYFHCVGCMDTKNPNMLIGFIQDITNSKTTETEQNHYSCLLWEQIVKVIPLMIFIKQENANFQYVQCNENFANFIGKTPLEIVGKTDSEIFNRSQDVDFFREWDMKVIKEGVSDFYETIQIAEDKLCRLHIVKMPFKDKDGHSLVIGMASDITEKEQSLRLSEIAARILSEIVQEPDFNKILPIVGKAIIEIIACQSVIFAQCKEGRQLYFLQECDKKSLHKFVNGKDKKYEKIWNSCFDLMTGNESVFFNRMGDEPRFSSLCLDFSDYADKALVVVPVVVQNKLVDIMIIIFSTPRNFTEFEKNTLQTIVNCIKIIFLNAKQKLALNSTQRKQERQVLDRLAINDCFRVFLDSDYMKIPFDEILEIIRQHLGASHCYVLHIDNETNIGSCLAEAVNQERKIFENNFSILFDPQAYWYNELENKELIYWQDLSSEKKREKLDKPWQRIVTDFAIQSWWVVALKLGGTLWGFLGIDYNDQAERTFSLEDEEFVRSAANLVSLILIRRLQRDNLIKTKDDLTEALEHAKAAEKAKSFFLASMSHEIRTPLNAVIGFTELMKDSHMDYKIQQECLENIYISGTALLQLINDILDLSKLEADQMPIIPESVDFSKFCQDVCRPFQYSADIKNLALIIDVPEEIPCLMLDQIRIRQIFFNLIGNAIKFTKFGSIKLSAKFTPLSIYEGALLIQVIDTGIGISEEDQKKIFEPFVQLSKMRGTNSSNNGTGLGLVIVRKLVDKMGGTLVLKSKEGQGTTFSILLPQIKTAHPELNHMNLELADSNPTLGVVEKITKIENLSCDIEEKINVLVFDDFSVSSRIILAMLKQIRVKAIQVVSKEEVLMSLKEKKIDWLFINFINEESVHLAKLIRENSVWNHIHLVIMTTDIEKVKITKDLFDDILIKPVCIERLKACLFREGNYE